MAYFISVETKGESPLVLYWNRRKSEWQENLTTACHYPTAKGVERIFLGMTRYKWPYVNGRPVYSVTWKGI